MALVLPTTPLEHPAQDYARLRAEGLELLGRLAGEQWTDFNAHDPGITILEQLCYAITDLAYRIDHPIADLLSGGDTAKALPGPADILTCNPVTRDDLRRLVLGLPGVANAWVEAPEAPEPSIHYRPATREICVKADPMDRGVRQVKLSGLHRIAVQAEDPGAFKKVVETLHASRPLGEDFLLEEPRPYEIGVKATIEIGPTNDPAAVLSQIVATIRAYLQPTLRFTSLADALAANKRIDEVLQGPWLERGLLLEPLPEPRSSVRVSDLLRALMDLPAVRAVPSIVLVDATGATERWVVKVPAGSIPTLSNDPKLTAITLRRAGLALPEQDLPGAPPAPAPLDVAAELCPPVGRDRDVARYRSIRHQLPAAYGVGSLSASTQAPGTGPAQARQLAAYLLLFDQLLANEHAQLAHARNLLSPEGSSPVQTYVAGTVEDALADVCPRGGAPPIETDEAGRERRLRFLSHLLARFAEELGDPLHVRGDQLDDLINAREAFLRDHARLSGARGAGQNILAQSSRGGFEERLLHKLGLSKESPGFFVVEHILLRPIAEDALGADPESGILLGNAEEDPWSLRVTFVCERGSDKPAELVERTILAETPAHLERRILWVGEGELKPLEDAWSSFRGELRRYRRGDASRHLMLRDARDRVIKLLGLADPYPLRDLPPPEKTFFLPDQVATIELTYTQVGVTYALFQEQNDGSWREVARADGAGESLVQLEAVKEPDNRRYWIRAQRGTRAAWLQHDILIKRGVDTSREIEIVDSPPLVSSIHGAPPSPARLASHGDLVGVAIIESQRDVHYELIDQEDRVVSIGPAVGNGDAVVLQVRAAEDIDLRVRGRKGTDPGDEPTDLEQVLPLRVRADPTLDVSVSDVVVYGQQTTVCVADTQASARYRVWRRAVLDEEYVFGETAPAGAIEAIAGGRAVRVRAPEPRIDDKGDVVGFQRVGAEAAGTGGPLNLVVSNCVKDAVLVVQAVKDHRTGLLGSAGSAPSHALLASKQLLLVEPDARRALTLAPIGGGLYQVEGGEPGVYYEFRTDRSSAAPIDTAYFHKAEKGIGRPGTVDEGLRVEVDFAVARDAAVVSSATPPPVVDLGGASPGTPLHVRARKAMNGLEVDLVPPAPLTVP